MFIDTNTNFLFREDHEQLRYEDFVLVQAWSTGQSPARIGKTYDHKNLQEHGTDLTELQVEAKKIERGERR